MLFYNYFKNQLYERHLKQTVTNSHSFLYSATYIKENYTEHRLNLKPCLDIIKNKSWNKLKKVNEIKQFVETDVFNLFNPASTIHSRDAYYSTLVSNYRSRPYLFRYSLGLIKLGMPYEALDLARGFFHENFLEIKQIFELTRLTKIQNHPRLDEVVEILSSRINVLSNSELDTFLTVAHNHEMFALSTLEPFLILIIGHTLFFQLFVPLHQEGGFIYFMEKVVDRQKRVRNRLTTMAHDASTSTRQFFHPVFQSRLVQGSLASSFFLGSLVIGNQFFKVPVVSFIESTFLRDSVQNYLSTGEGFKHEYVVNTKDFFSRFFFELGSGLSSITSNFIKGWLSKYSDVLTIAATAIDKKGIGPKK